MTRFLPALAVVAAAATLPLTALPSSADSVATTTDADIQIIGGEYEKQPYPWLGRLTGACGASMISDQWMVTAAHCLKSHKPGVDLPEVRINSLEKWSGGTVIQVAKEFPHPQFPDRPGKIKRFDIGLIKLAQPYRGGTITLADQRYPAGTTTRLLGWGAEKENDDGTLVMAKTLKGLTTQVREDKGCDAASGEFMPGYEYCTDNPRGVDGACYGDSGGPQLTKVDGRWTLIGVTSRGGQFCGTSPSVYTDVYAYQGWIADTIRREDGKLPPEIQAWIAPSPTPDPTVPVTPGPSASPTASATPTPIVTTIPTSAAPTPSPSPTNWWPWPFPWPWK